MKEEEPMLQNQNSSSPTTHKSIQPETIDIKQLKREENATDDTKEEELPMSSTSSNGGLKEEESGREKLKRHRVEVAGQVGIPDAWGHEDLLKDWIDCSTFDFELVPKGIMSARASLAEQGRKEHSGLLGLHGFAQVDYTTIHTEANILRKRESSICVLVLAPNEHLSSARLV